MKTTPSDHRIVGGFVTTRVEPLLNLILQEPCNEHGAAPGCSCWPGPARAACGARIARALDWQAAS